MYQDLLKTPLKTSKNGVGLTKSSSICQHYYFIYYLKLSKNNSQKRCCTMSRAHYTETKESLFV